MSDNTNVKAVNEKEVKNAVAETTEKPAEEAMPTVAYVLKQIELIRQDNEHINRAIAALMAMSDGEQSETPGAPSNTVGSAKAEALADVVKCRETTNQKLLAFYEKVYDDLMNKKRSEAKTVVIASNHDRNVDDAIDKAIEESINKSIEDSIAATIAQSSDVGQCWF